MTTLYTDLDVCNIGLNKAGVGAVNTIDPEEISSQKEATCATLYPVARNLVLSMHDWNICRDKIELSRDADTTPLNAYQYAHFLPGNMLDGPYAVYGDGGLVSSKNYDIYGFHLYSDYENVEIDFKKRPDESTWPYYLVNLVATAFAAAATIPLTEQIGKADALHEKAFGTPSEKMQGGLMGVAKLLDARSAPAPTLFAGGDPLSATRY